MNIGQLVYASTADFGWKKTHSDGIITRDAEAFFDGISAVSPKSDEVYALDYRNGVYILSRTLKGKKDSFGRNSHLMHAYIFYETEWEELFGNFRSLLALDNFIFDYTEEITSIAQLPSKEFNTVSKAVSGLKLDKTLLMACVCEAVAENKNMEIILPSCNYDAVRSFLGIIYSYLPLSMRKLITFGSNTSEINRLITFVSPADKSAGLSYDATDASVSGVESVYKEIASAIIGGEAETISRLEGMMRDSAKRCGYSSKAVCEAFEKLMIQSNKVDISKEDPFALFVSLMTDAKYTDPVYARQLCELLKRFLKDGVNLSKSFDQLVTAYDKTDIAECRDAIASFIIDSCEAFPDINCRRVLETVSVSDALRRDIVNKISSQCRDCKLAAEYLNMFFLDEKYYKRVAAPSLASKDRIDYKSALALLAKEINSNDVKSLEILRSIENTDPACYKMIETVLHKDGNDSIIQKMYIGYFLRRAGAHYEIKILCEKLSDLGISTDDFVRASADQYVKFCMDEYRSGKLDLKSVISEVSSYVGKAGLNPAQFIPRIMDDYKADYWDNFEWENLDFVSGIDPTLSDGSTLCSAVSRVCSIASQLSDGALLAQTDKDYIALLCTDRYISQKEDRNYVIKRLADISCNLTADFDLYFLFKSVSAKKLISEFNISDLDSLEKYCESCLNQNRSCALESQQIFISLYKYIFNKGGNGSERILELLKQYASDDKKLMHAIDKIEGVAGHSPAVLALITAAAFCISLLLRRFVPSAYFRGFADSFIVMAMLAMCVFDALHPPRAASKSIASLIRNCLILAVIIAAWILILKFVI